MEILNYYKLLIIFGIGLGIRLILVPFDIPIANDGFDAFIYASKLVQESQLPNGFNTGNTGWQYFLSIFFNNSNFDEPLNMMNIQRTLSTIISASIVFPLYILLRRFFEEKFALLGCILFIFEPRFLLSSLLGINYPFFIFLLLIALVSFLNNQKNMIFLTFTCVAISSLVRFESLLFIPFFILMYAIKNCNKKEIIRLTSAIFVLIIILLPISALRTEANEEDGLISQLVAGPSFVSKHVIGDIPDIDDQYYNNTENRFFDFVSLSITNMITLFGLVLVPYFVIFCIIGVFFILKNRKYRNLNYEKITIILFSIIIIIPAFYAYGRGIMEVRYLFGLLPIFSIIGTYGIYILYNKINRKNLIFLSTICIVFIFSTVFIDLQIPNYEYESASYFISKEILMRTDTVNSFHGDWHLKSAHLLTNWPNLPEANQSGKYSIIINKIDVDEYGNFEEFLIDSKAKKLEYVVVSNRGNMIEFEKYPFLIEEINSHDYGYNEKFQIFKIVNSKSGE
tara:strand:+ start:2396 stop:3925 length:1530 start_codon:yes stop_codon:yes gene_type:complete